MPEISRRDFLRFAGGAAFAPLVPRQVSKFTHTNATLIHNPILPGFNPDPSIVRVGDDYYIATSTFEWFPAVQIHHSRDLVHWRLLTRVLTHRSQLDLRGANPSDGVWAPCLSHDGIRFYLIYTDMKSRRVRFWDCNNYLVSAEQIEGPWSEPVYLNSSGFDPSLFHNDDGRKWLLNMLQDPRDGQNRFAGIVLQEYSPVQQKLVGEPQLIFQGTSLGITEGPNLYKHNGWYYLICAEGGTGLRHAVTVARSHQIQGPYEVDPQNPMLTSYNKPELVLQKAGHASLVQTQGGEWYIAHLCARPLSASGRCTLGRETALQKVIWDAEGWLRLASGGASPQVDVPAPNLLSQPWPAEPERDDFDQLTLNIHFQSPREPMDDTWLSLTERPGFLRLHGRMSPNSRFNQSTVARRIQAFHVGAETCVEFAPRDQLQMAGLLAMYDEIEWYWLAVSGDATLGKVLRLLHRDDATYSELLPQPISLANWERCYLRSRIDNESLLFFYSPDGSSWTQVGGVLDATQLSDEYPTGRFTGSFFALCAMDLHGTRLPADFDYFTYSELDQFAWLPVITK